MNEVKSFWCHEASNILCVRASDFDRVTAERDATQACLDLSIGREDALQQRLTAADEELDRSGGYYLNKNAECLQLRKRADVLEGLLLKAAEFEVGESDNEAWQDLLSQISLELTPLATLKPAEGCSKPCACPGCNSPRRANSPFCAAHRSAKSRTRGQDPLTAEGLEWLMQNDGAQQ